MLLLTLLMKNLFSYIVASARIKVIFTDVTLKHAEIKLPLSDKLRTWKLQSFHDTQWLSVSCYLWLWKAKISLWDECLKRKEEEVIVISIFVSWLLESIYGPYKIILLIPKTSYTTKSIFWVSTYYATSSIYGVGETTRPGSSSPLIQVGRYRLGLRVGFTTSWHLSAYRWDKKNQNNYKRSSDLKWENVCVI